ncbi:hypothetical protein KI387_036221, partial [Taxus chinensis]
MATHQVQEGFSSNKAPLFDGTNYAFWSVRMRTYLMALGFDIWQSVAVGYIIPSTPPIDQASKKAFENNAKAMNAILCGLLDSEFVKVMQCDTAKEIWDKLLTIYEGDDKSMEELHGILTAYEMRTESNRPSKKEVAFKVSQKEKIKEPESNENSSSEEDEKEALFIRKLKKGSGKYKGKLPFKGFNCGKIGHFAAKCPEKEDSDDEESKPKFKREFKKIKEKKRFGKKKKNLYSKGSSRSSEESGISDSDSDNEEILFMAIKDDLERDEDMEEKGELSKTWRVLAKTRRVFSRAWTNHTKKRNKLTQKWLNDLVFVQYNLRLCIKKVEATSEELIDLDEIDPYSEWTGQEEENPAFTANEIASFEREAMEGEALAGLRGDIGLDDIFGGDLQHAAEEPPALPSSSMIDPDLQPFRRSVEMQPSVGTSISWLSYSHDDAILVHGPTFLSDLVGGHMDEEGAFLGAYDHFQFAGISRTTVKKRQIYGAHDYDKAYGAALCEHHQDMVETKTKEASFSDYEEKKKADFNSEIMSHKIGNMEDVSITPHPTWEGRYVVDNPSAKTDDDKPGLVAILQKVLQLYASKVLSRRSYAMKGAEIIKAEEFLETIIKADEEDWSQLLIGGLTIGGGSVSLEELNGVIEKRLERTLMRT